MNLLDNALEVHAARHARSRSSATGERPSASPSRSPTAGPACRPATRSASSRSSTAGVGRRARGAGLGLAICQAASSRRTAGRSGRTTCPEGGVAFLFTLPLTRSAARSPMTPPRPRCLSPSSSSSRTSRRSAASCAPPSHAPGYRLFEAATGAEGLVEVATRQPDVVIVDLGLPDMDGLEVIRRLREWSSRARHRAVRARPGARQGHGARRGRRRLRRPSRSAPTSCSRASAWRCATRPAARASADARLHGRRARRSTRRGAWSPSTATRCTSRRSSTSCSPRSCSTPGKVLTHRQLLREVWGPNARRGRALPARLHGAAAAQDRARPRAAALPAHRAGRRLPARGRVRDQRPFPGRPFARGGNSARSVRAASVPFEVPSGRSSVCTLERPRSGAHGTTPP